MMRLQDFMTRNVQTINSSKTAAEAREMMRRYRVHHLVVTTDSRLLGIVSDLDLARAGDEQFVSEIMTPNVVSVEPRATVREAANKMRGRSIGCLPVVEAGKLVGIVTTSDLLELLGRGMEHPAVKGERRTLPRNMRALAGQR